MTFFPGFIRLVVYRNGVLIRNDSTTSPYTDDSILSTNTCYKYSVTPYDTDGGRGITQYITIYTLADMTYVRVYSKSNIEIVFQYEGNYSGGVNIARNGTTIDTYNTGNTFTDTELTPNTSYTYVFTPYGDSPVQNVYQVGVDYSITVITLPHINSVNIYSETTTQIVLSYPGNYTNVSITRNDTTIATQTTGNTFTDTGLIPNTSYIYVVTPYNSSGEVGTTVSITHSTLPNITSLNIYSETISQIVLIIYGNYVIVHITRNGTYIANNTSSSYTDYGLSPNTSYTYVVTPYNSSGDAGTIATITQSTLPYLTNVNISNKTTTRIIFQFTGNYTVVNITRNGSSIVNNSGSTYTDTGLTPNSPYTYIVTPYNSTGDINTAITITQNTLPILTSLIITGKTTSQIVLVYSGIYTNVNITKNGTIIATNITGFTYTDTGLTVNTSYTYIVTPIGISDEAGTTLSITQSTLPNLTALSISSETDTQIVLGYSGNYTNMNIYRDGVSIATNITGNTFTDTGLTSNISYTYIVTPIGLYETVGISGSITESTLPNLTSLHISSETTTQIVLVYAGNYTFVDISRNGVTIATDITGSTSANNIIGTTYTDTGLTANTSYTYIVTPYNSSGYINTSFSITHSTFAVLTSLNITSKTTTQMVLEISGNYMNVKIKRNGTIIATNITGTTYTDTGLSINTSYTYIVIPYNSSGDDGTSGSITENTLPNLESLIVSNVTATQIVLAYTGNYIDVSISINGNTTSNIIGSTYTYTGLTGNTTYTFIVTPYNPDGDTNTTYTITQKTLPIINTLIVSSKTASQIVLDYSGNYTNVSITRNGTSIAANITGTTDTDTGLIVNTSYIYIVTPYNSSGIAGYTSTIIQNTLPNLTSLSVSSETDTQIVLVYGGNYINVSITRNGTSIAMNITGTTYIDTGLTVNTSYTYIVTPYNSDSNAGTSGSITKITSANITSLNISGETTTQIVLDYSGNYINTSITRNGTSIATNITGTTYTDNGLIPNTSYTYIVTPYNSAYNPGIIGTITKNTFPNITSLSIPSKTISQIVLVYGGNYESISITRNGTSIATNIIGTTFTDTGLTPNISYTYIVTPYNSSGDFDTISTITKRTLANITSFSVSGETINQIVLVYSGNYANVSITRDGSSIATNITGTTYTDTGLIANTSYRYIVIPYNSSGDIGITGSITQSTLPNITSLNVSSETTSQISLVYTGNYTNVSITQNGTSIANNITGTTYTDTGLIENTSYTYIVTPYNSSGNAGTAGSYTQNTLPNLTSLNVSSETTTQIVLDYSGNYANNSITRNGTTITTNITGTTYTDTGLIVNTSYTYVVIPYNLGGNAGTAGSITKNTLPNLTSLSIPSETINQIVLEYTGNYTNVSITRNGTTIATNITGTTNLDTGLLPNTSYTYVVTPYNSSGTGTYATITKYTLPNLTSFGILSKTTTQIVLVYAGNYTNLSITRDGSSIATNITGTTFMDKGLDINTSYIYVVTPYNPDGIIGTSVSYTQSTLATLSSMSVMSETTTQIVLKYSGNYASVSITRNGTTVATNITGTTFTDTGLIVNTSYTYIVTFYNSSGDISTAATIRQNTLPNLTSFSIPSVTTTQIVLAYTGNYTYVSITRNGTVIVNNNTGTTFTDTLLMVNTSYTYVVTPYNNDGNIGSEVSITKSTLPNLTSLIVSSESTKQISLLFTGNYTNVSISCNGTIIVTNITGTTFTDYGLNVNTSYTYVVIPYNIDGISNTSLSITKKTLPNITSISIPSVTATQIVLVYSGNYTNVSITRNGTSIATNITGITYTDTGLTSNTSYIYVVTPYNTDGNTGTISSITKNTLPNLTSLSISSETTTQIVLTYSGNYTNVSITRNGTSIATNITGITYTDTGLTSNTPYTYVMTPYNADGNIGSTNSITKYTLPVLTTLSVSSVTISQIILTYSGSYANVSITRNGTAIATNITGNTYTDSSGLTENTSYTYVITPYNTDGNIGYTNSITKYTLSNITSLSVSSETTTQIVLIYAGNYTNVSITRNGTSIATNITGTIYTDTGLKINTSYTYIVTPYNVSGTGIAGSITKYTLPNVTSLRVSSETDSQIVLSYSGNYTNVSIIRNGTAIATNITGITYTDSSGLTSNTSYTYIVTPYNTDVNIGSTSSITLRTLPNITSLTVSSETITQIVLIYSGNYNIVSITRNGTTIATNITGTTYTDVGLTVNTSYTYIVSPYNLDGNVGISGSITKYTLPNLTSLSIPSETATQIVLAYTGNYTNVSITRDGTPMVTNITGTTYTDSSGLTVNTSYTYVVTPYNSAGIGYTLSITQKTLPNITSLSISSQTTTQIVFAYSGNYTNVSIIRNGITVATNITGTTFTDTGLIVNTSYTYLVYPYNSDGNVGIAGSITQRTLPNLTSLNILSETTTQIVLVYSGNYTNVNITRNGTTIATNITGTTYTDTGLTVNTSYTYIVTSNNSSGTGSTLSITRKTLPNITSLSISSETTTQIILVYAGNYTNVSITRNGTAIATNITGTTFTDTGLTVNVSYTYLVTPYNTDGNTGVIGSITQSTLPNITSLSISSETTTQIVLLYYGNYTNVSITRNGAIIATNIIGTIYTDTGLTVNIPYTYIVIPYNLSGNAGSTLSIFINTLPNITSLSISSQTTSQIILVYSGNYTNVSITRDGTAVATNITGTTYTDSGLSSNTSYTYVVTPYNSDGNIGNSGIIIQNTITNVPTIGSATVLGSSLVSVYFTQPGGTGTITGYTVTSSSGNFTGTGTSSPITVSGLTPNTPYTFTVTATNSSGTSASSSSTTSVTTISSAPTIGTATIIDSSSISISFTSPSGTGTIIGYNVFSNPGGLTEKGVSSPIIISGLSPNTAYTFYVNAINSGGSSIPSNSSISVTTLPMVISLSVSSETTTQISLLFSGIYTNVSITRNGTTVSTNNTGTTFTDTGLTANTPYTYIVTPKNSSGVTGTTTTLTRSTISGSPTSATSTVIDSSSISIYFTPPAGTGTIISYTVTSSPGGFTGTGASSPISVSGLTSNTSYTFTVKATNNGGTSVVSGSSTSKTTLPSMTSLNVSSETTTQIVLAYTGYYSNLSITRNGTIIAVNIIGTTYTDSNLTPNTSYTYIVTPNNSVSIKGTTSIINPTTISNPPTIGVVTVTSESSVNVEFTAPNGSGTITSYTVTSSPGGFTGSGLSSPISVSGLTPNTSYTFSVTATNSGGTSVESTASVVSIVNNVVAIATATTNIATNTAIILETTTAAAANSILSETTTVNTEITATTTTTTNLILSTTTTAINLILSTTTAANNDIALANPVEGPAKTIAVNGGNAAQTIAVNGGNVAKTIAANGIAATKTIAVNGGIVSQTIAVNGIAATKTIAVNGGNAAQTIAVNAIAAANTAANGQVNDTTVAVNKAILLATTNATNLILSETTNANKEILLATTNATNLILSVTTSVNTEITNTTTALTTAITEATTTAMNLILSASITANTAIELANGMEDPDKTTAINAANDAQTITVNATNAAATITVNAANAAATTAINAANAAATTKVNAISAAQTIAVNAANAAATTAVNAANAAFASEVAAALA